MNLGQIRKFYERFKRWQQSPRDYEFASGETQHCQNCEHDFTGNYCPYCSQKAGEGPINWRSVRQSFMDIWGLGSRSMPRSIWHLLLRPGYLISDYIDGKRQVSFPPVKMLFFVAVIVVLFVFYLIPFLLGSTFDVYGGSFTDGINNWIQAHFAWTYFGMAILGILPTWILFRHAPRHTRHTLPQGFFIQIFLCVLNLVVSFIILLPLLLINYTVYLYVAWAILIFYYVITYKQLFGYSILGTLWRVLIVLGFVVFVLDTLTYLFLVAGTSQAAPDDSIIMHCVYGLMLLGIGWVIDFISRKMAYNTKNGQNDNNHLL